MRMQKRNKKKRILIKYVRLLLLFMCTCFLSAGCGKKIAAPVYDDEVEPVNEITMFAIITNLDEVNEKITLRAVNYTTEVTLSYNGGADVKDKYGSIVSMTQIELGSVVDIV